MWDCLPKRWPHFIVKFTPELPVDRECGGVQRATFRHGDGLFHFTDEFLFEIETDELIQVGVVHETGLVRRKVAHALDAAIFFGLVVLEATLQFSPKGAAGALPKGFAHGAVGLVIVFW